MKNLLVCNSTSAVAKIQKKCTDAALNPISPSSSYELYEGISLASFEPVKGVVNAM
jgi:hypothetical protein